MRAPAGRQRAARAVLALAALAVAAAITTPPADAQQERDGPWDKTGALHTSRDRFTATLLKSGKVLVAGGLPGSRAGSGDSLASAELYDPSTGTWSSTGSMTVPRAGHTATLLDNAKVLVVGGRSRGDQELLASAELYDPATGNWSSTGSMAAPRTGDTATLLDNGNVLVIGGSATTELYDPATGTWASADRLPVARQDHTATLLKDGKVLVAGGFLQDPKVIASSGELYAPAAAYDPRAGRWGGASASGGRRAEHSAILIDHAKVLVAGGRTDPGGGGTNPAADVAGRTSTVELYDGATDTWGVTGALPSAPLSQEAVQLQSGKVLLVGVFGSGPGALKALAHLYDPTTGKWTGGGPTALTTTGFAPSLTVLEDGKVLAVEGGGNAAYVYTPSGTGTRRWPWAWAASAVVALTAVTLVAVHRRRRRRGQRRAAGGGGFATAR